MVHDALRQLDAPTARLDALLPRQSLWVDLTAAVSSNEGPAARLEVGGLHHFDNGLSLAGFVAAEAQSTGVKAETGVRLTF